MGKRFFDIIFSFFGLIVLSPFLLLISVLIALGSRGGVFFIQKRVGRNNKDFRLVKFRTMRAHSEHKGLFTIGQRDPRVTRLGYFLRKYKIDEFPQLINVLKGDMSIVGPRPEVRKYVELYTPEQSLVLTVRPGITGLASLEYVHENKILGESDNPEETYLKEMMPRKLELNLEYVKSANFRTDLRLILKTFRKVYLPGVMQHPK